MFLSKKENGIIFLTSALLIVLPSIIIWILFGEFNVLNKDWVHVKGKIIDNNVCYDSPNANAQIVTCTENSYVAKYTSSYISNYLIAIMFSILGFSIIMPLILKIFKFVEITALSYSFTIALAMTILVLSSGIPIENTALQIFVRAIILLVSCVITFYMLNNILLNLVVNKSIYKQKDISLLIEEIKKDNKYANENKKLIKSKNIDDNSKYVVEDK